jgi:hypothetical protein
MRSEAHRTTDVFIAILGTLPEVSNVMNAAVKKERDRGGIRSVPAC